MHVEHAKPSTEGECDDGGDNEERKDDRYGDDLEYHEERSLDELVEGLGDGSVH